MARIATSGKLMIGGAISADRYSTFTDVKAFQLGGVGTFDQVVIRMLYLHTF
ncbi:MAG: hypothetical protein H0U49_11680 [Parachlamydiaceae bacterium]|nr:hypothetical protein [Parachlamydiaceae bacterium]